MDDPQARLDAFVGRYTAEVAALGTAVIEALRRRLPTADRLVYDNYNALAVGFCPGDRVADVILSVALYPRWVSLFFLQGVGLDDPAGVLRGQGSVVRHIVLADAADLERPEVAALIDQALAKARVPMAPDGAGRLIIKSVSARQRPRRPAGSA